MHMGAVVWIATRSRSLTGKFDLGVASMLAACGQAEAKGGPPGRLVVDPWRPSQVTGSELSFVRRTNFKIWGHSVI